MKNLLVVIRNIFVPLAVLFLALAPMTPAMAQQEFVKQNQMCVGPKSYKVIIGTNSDGTPIYDVQGASDVPTIQGLECLVANILASAITLIGIVAFIMFLVGGFQYLTSGDNVKGTEQGRNSISYAIIGIVVALASFMILNIIANLTGIKTILQFSTQLPK